MASVESVRRRFDSTTWLGVGIIGIALFLLGIYVPALARFPYHLALEVTLAVGGGIVSMVGFSFWWDQREDERLHPRVRALSGHARELAIAPSFEVYHPPPPAVRPQSPPPDDDPEP